MFFYNKTKKKNIHCGTKKMTMFNTKTKVKKNFEFKVLSNLEIPFYLSSIFVQS